MRGQLWVLGEWRVSSVGQGHLSGGEDGDGVSDGGALSDPDEVVVGAGAEKDDGGADGAHGDDQGQVEEEDGERQGEARLGGGAVEEEGRVGEWPASYFMGCVWPRC